MPGRINERINYIISMAPQQTPRVAAALREIGVEFDPSGNMIALPEDPVREGIFTGETVGNTIPEINSFLETQGQGPRLHDQFDQMPLETQQDLLDLVTNHADWESGHWYRLNHLDLDQWRRFAEEHPGAVTPAANPDQGDR